MKVTKTKTNPPVVNAMICSSHIPNNSASHPASPVPEPPHLPHPSLTASLLPYSLPICLAPPPSVVHGVLQFHRYGIRRF
ncbi:hypothetical protein NMY22_g4196 [Coprinellus aureogranulatus]|nr:hypothetical protein NMY22_g4196 [Coprinellus aureogranulatus]